MSFARRGKPALEHVLELGTTRADGRAKLNLGVHTVERLAENRHVGGHHASRDWATSERSSSSLCTRTELGKSSPPASSEGLDNPFQWAGPMAGPAPSFKPRPCTPPTCLGPPVHGLRPNLAEGYQSNIWLRHGV